MGNKGRLQRVGNKGHLQRVGRRVGNKGHLQRVGTAGWVPKGGGKEGCS